MRNLKIITALVASCMIFYVGGGAYASQAREITKTKAISVNYTSTKTAYQHAHTACQKYWTRDIANIISERPSFSVEIVTVNTSPKTVSALCVSKKYINDDVRKVAKF